MLGILKHRIPPPPVYKPSSESHRQSKSSATPHEPPASSQQVNTNAQATDSSLPSTSMTAGKEWRAKWGLGDVSFGPAKAMSGLGDGIDGKYKPINDPDSPTSDSPETPENLPLKPNGKGKERATPEDEQDTMQTCVNPSPPLTPKSIFNSTPNTSPTRPPITPKSKQTPQKLPPIPPPPPLHWPANVGHLGRGLVNVGNTCFLNSVLQCLLYTRPLLHALDDHRQQCPKNALCTICALQQVRMQNFGRQTGYFTPGSITDKLQHIAKGMRRGRQEDAHEFLRYLVESLHKCWLHTQELPLRSNHEFTESRSWVYQIFGGKTRSRVKCKRCGHNSDTFEACLDLSLDLYGVKTIEQALAAFVRVEKLAGEGKDRYKCEKWAVPLDVAGISTDYICLSRCKVPVDAEKQFTIHKAPTIFTIHLKRFTVSGRKVNKLIEYSPRLDLSQYVSEGEFGPTYELYGVISHSGSGPHHGHYTAHVKAPSGKWHEMNDEDVGPGTTNAPLGMRDAYVLFYVQDKTSRLNGAIGVTNGSAPRPRPNKRRIESDDEEEEGPPRPEPPGEAKLSDRPLGGPQIAAASAREQEKINLGQSLMAKIESAVSKASSAPAVTSTVNATAIPPKAQQATSLVPYADNDEEDIGEMVDDPREEPEKKFIGPLLPPDHPRSHLPSPPALGPTPTILSSSIDAMDISADDTTSAAPRANPSPSIVRKRSSLGASSDTEDSTDLEKRWKKQKHNRNHHGGRWNGLGSSNLNSSRGDERMGPEKQRTSLKMGMKPRQRKSLILAAPLTTGAIVINDLALCIGHRGDLQEADALPIFELIANATDREQDIKGELPYKGQRLQFHKTPEYTLALLRSRDPSPHSPVENETAGDSMPVSQSLGSVRSGGTDGTLRGRPLNTATTPTIVEGEENAEW
ncbi:hypothetical protein FRB99_005534 [Tulasnella sp. 403]|nr:hypothetical protein FRB99_005534 [Tulasnella sp. 403]